MKTRRTFPSTRNSDKIQKTSTPVISSLSENGSMDHSSVLSESYKITSVSENVKAASAVPGEKKLFEVMQDAESLLFPLAVFRRMPSQTNKQESRFRLEQRGNGLIFFRRKRKKRDFTFR